MEALFLTRRKDRDESRWNRVVHMHDVDGVTFATIGRSIGVTTGRARGIYLRAKKLAAMRRERGLTP